MTPFMAPISERPRLGQPSTSATLTPAFLSTVGNQVNVNGILSDSSGCGREVFVRCRIHFINRTIASVDIVLDLWNNDVVSHFASRVGIRELIRLSTHHGLPRRETRSRRFAQTRVVEPPIRTRARLRRERA